MTKLKDLAKKHTTDPAKSTFWASMLEALNDAKDFSRRFDDEQKHRVLNFFHPEWQRRDKRVFPRLRNWLVPIPATGFLSQFVRFGGVTEHTVEVADTLELSYRSTMGALLTLVGYGLARRAEPYTTQGGNSTFSVQFASKTDMEVALAAVTAGFNTAKETQAVLDFFSVDRSVNPVNVVPTLRKISELGGSSKCQKVAEDVFREMSLSGTTVFTAALLEQRTKHARALVTGALILLCESGQVERCAPFTRVAEVKNRGKPTRKVTIPVINVKLKDAVVEVADMSPGNAKEFFKNLKDPEPALKIAEPSNELILSPDVTNAIYGVVQTAVLAALVDKDREQMNAIKALLRSHGLDDTNPLATIKAKLSKKKAPKLKTET
jgi:hypothetical protein